MAPRFNLHSPNGINAPCNLGDLSGWFATEIQTVADLVIRQVVLEVAEHLDRFVCWPSKAVLLWHGCDRRRKYHIYGPVVRNLAYVSTLRLDSRANGPAVAAYCFAGGVRPPRFGSENAWSVHHIYSGKFPYYGKETTVHAIKDGRHFTQSAGLIAVHPIADQMCDEFPAFAWLLRALAFQKFGYDPDCVFSDGQRDEFGFFGKSCVVIREEATNGKEACSEDGSTQDNRSATR